MIAWLVTSLLTVALSSPPQATIAISTHARSMQPGEVIVLSIVPPAGSKGLRVRAFGHEIAAYQGDGDAWQAIVGVDLDVKPGTYQVDVESGSGPDIVRAAYSLHILPKTFRTRRLTVNEAFVTPPKSEEARIAREAALLAATWKSSAGTRLWLTPFLRPVPQAANSAFGTRSIFNGKPRNSHGGADFLSPAGTPIQSPNSGRVVVARNLYYSGNTVIIDHGLGVFSLLAHLSVIGVKEGDQIAAGDRVGLVGATGRVTGPHLHWAVRIADARVDPLSLLDVLGRPATTP